MANGKTHSIINFFSIACASLLLFLFSTLPYKIVFISTVSAIFGTIFLSPDLDLKHSESLKSWGWFKWIWTIYHRCFRHRKFSHYFVLGTISRILYLMWIAFLFLMIYNFVSTFIHGLNLENTLIAENNIASAVKGVTYWIFLNKTNLCAIFFGLMYSDSLHFVTDIVYSAYKKYYNLY